MASGLDDNRPPAEIEDKDAAAEDAEQAKRRKRLRSLAIAWALFALVLLFFFVTIVRLGGNVANRPL
ncbi:MAG: hypothetical protein WBX25_01900 [Rhodomicrobium sp.]